jgi:hypothetical protein
VCVAPTFPIVREGYAQKNESWCVWNRLSGNPPGRSVVKLSPLDSYSVAVARPPRWLAPRADASDCSIVASETLSVARLVAATVGTFMVCFAPALSRAMPVRLISGALVVMALPLLLLLVWVLPCTDSQGVEKDAVAGGIVLTIIITAAISGVFGLVGVPSEQSVVLAYVTIFGLLGLALTYYYIDAWNDKVRRGRKVAI